MSEHRGTDPAFLEFLRARLVEEREAAATRAPSPGLGMLEELLDGLAAGRPPDPMSRDLLVVAYADHPDFRPEWNRWRRAAG